MSGAAPSTDAAAVGPSTATTALSVHARQTLARRAVDLGDDELHELVRTLRRRFYLVFVPMAVAGMGLGVAATILLDPLPAIIGMFVVAAGVVAVDRINPALVQRAAFDLCAEHGLDGDEALRLRRAMKRVMPPLLPGDTRRKAWLERLRAHLQERR